jgi:GDP-4-dehydro-6-deoxy-D-mannose reductase
MFGEIGDAAFLRKVLQSHCFDVIFHLAGRDASFGAPELYSSNVVGTAALLDAIRNLGRTKLKIVLLGSSAQYGLLGNDPVGEESPFHPITDYGISKMACEAMGRLMFKQTGQPILCARGFNIIGPGQKAKLLQGTVIEQIIAIEAGRRPAIIELGDLSAYRDFIDVRDVAKGLIAVALHGEAGGGPLK